MHRQFTCSYEAMLSIVSLYYFNRMTARFDRNTMALIIFQSLSFIIRNTSPIPWVPILLLKAYEYGFQVITNYMVGFVFLFMPMFGASVIADSLYYGQLTIVPWNFIKVNVLDG